MKRFGLLALSLIAAIIVYPQKTKNVSAKYTLVVPESTSIEKAKYQAVARAKIDAIEKAFGSYVSQTNVTKVDNFDGQSNVKFSSTGGSEVKGEWIETLTEPEYDISYANNMLSVSVSFKGTIREITSQQTNIKAIIMRNGIGEQFEDDEFNPGDEMYMSFTAPCQGYLVAYLVDNDDNAYRLLPYRRETEPHVKIETTDPILFFHRESAPQSKRRVTDEYTITASRSLEINTIYIIFSPNYISKAIDVGAGKGLPRRLSGLDFHKWLASARRQDYNLTVKEIPITIQQKE